MGGRRSGAVWAAPGYHRRMLEVVYTSLLVLSALVIGWFSVYAVYKLFKGQQ